MRLKRFISEYLLLSPAFSSVPFSDATLGFRFATLMGTSQDDIQGSVYARY